MPWQPGQSGNPSGRPKANPYMDKLLEEHAVEAVNVIVQGMRSDDEKTRLSASKEVLDRKYGKAAQSLTVAGDADSPLVTRIERVIVHSTNPDRSGI